MNCDVHVDGVRLEHVSEFKYLGYVLDKTGTGEAECSTEVASRRRVASVLESCTKHCLYLLLRTAVRQCYGRGVEEIIDEGVLRWFGHVERIAKIVYVGECAGSRSVSRPRRDGLTL